MKNIEAASLMMFIITFICIIIGITKASDPQLPEQVTDTAIPSSFASSSATPALS